MKKVFLAIVSVIVSVSVNAQVVKVYDTKASTTEPVATYTNSPEHTYKVVFEEMPSTDAVNAETTGKATATIDGKVVEIGWVQLWAGGPKFATRNVGATSDTGRGIAMSYADAVKAGSSWGPNWKTPSREEMDLMNSSKVEMKYTHIHGVYGWRFRGVQKGYTRNTLFLPSEEGSVPDGSEIEYWSSSTCEENQSVSWAIFLTCDDGYDKSTWRMENPWERCNVRPILSE